MSNTGIYTCFKSNLFNGVYNFNSDVIYVTLMGSNFVFDPTQTIYSQITGEITGGTYGSGGIAITGQGIIINGTEIDLTGASATWTNSTITGAYGCVLYDYTVANNPLICAWDFGGPYSSINGNFILTFANNAILGLN